MGKIIFVTIIVFCLIATGCTGLTTYAGSETVTFEGKTIRDKKLTLTGLLMKPKGDGPFPAVILLHGCSGMYSEHAGNTYNTWASRLVSWGYVTLRVDSLGPRNKTSICNNPFSILPFERGLDAYAGKSYMENQPYVDDKRIAVMGWSHGGWTTLYTVDNNRMNGIGTGPFNASIAFYPYCELPLIHLNAPLLILIGEEDDWTPAFMCENMKLTPAATDKFILKVYPNAYHGFDLKGVDIEVEGHKIKYDPAATENAIVQVKNFLLKHLQ